MDAITVMLVLDSLMILLLGVTILYCFKLNFRIKILQDSKNEFSQLIERFDATTQRAQQSIEELQNVSKKVHEQLSGRLDKANFLADDLAFMIEKGSKLADKMEDRLAGRSVDKSSQSGVAGKNEPRTNSALSQAVSAERRASSSGPMLRENRDKADALADRKRASLESVLNRVSPKEGAEELSGETARRRPAASARLRSKAEQELYDALKSGNS